MVDDDVPQVLRLLESSLAGGPTGKRTEAFFNWKHRQNPFGPSPGIVAVDGDEVVGVRLFMRWQFTAGNRTLRAVRAVDTATHPNYQRRGIFRTLTMSLLNDLETAGEVDLVFNTPNTESRPGYLTMGWSDVGRIGVRIGPGRRPLTVARGLRRARAASASGSPSAVRAASRSTPALPPAGCDLPPAASAIADPSTIQELLAQQSPTDRLRTTLSVDYLRWRYAEPPGLDYRSVTVVTGGEVAAIGLGRLRRRAELTELTLGDVLVRSGDVRSARHLLREARRAGPHLVTLHAAEGTEIAAAALRAGYLPSPGGINLTVNQRTDLPLDPALAASWRLSLGDLEVF